MKRVGIICTGISNTGSIYNVIKYLGYEPVLLNGDNDLINLKKSYFWVGHFDSGMRALKEKGFISNLGFCKEQRKLYSWNLLGHADVMQFQWRRRNEVRIN